MSGIPGYDYSIAGTATCESCDREFDTIVHHRRGTTSEGPSSEPAEDLCAFCRGAAYCQDDDCLTRACYRTWDGATFCSPHFEAHERKHGREPWKLWPAELLDSDEDGDEVDFRIGEDVVRLAYMEVDA